MAHETKENAIDVDLPPDLPADSMLSYNPTMVLLSKMAKDEDSSSKVRQSVSSQLSSEGRFRLFKRIGKGGFGEVFRAEQVELGRMVAVKRLRKDVLRKKDKSESDSIDHGFEIRNSFRQEVLTSANLEHPNIVPIHDLGVDSDGELMMAMKLIHGTPWDQMLFKDGCNKSLTPTEFLARHLPIFTQLCQAVAYSHSRGVVHRDLKPTQVIVGEYGEVLLMDWGLALIYDSETLTKDHECIPIKDLPTTESATAPAGTPAFMAPEQTERTAKNIGPWTDVYLLGGTLYYLLTLQPPHGSESAKESFLKARMGYVTPPHERTRRMIPKDLASLCMESLSPDPQDRPASVQQFLQGLQDYMSGASKRRESLAITGEVRRSCLESACNHYDGFADGLAKLAQADALWPDNPDVDALQMDLQVAYAKLALDHGDLALAKLQASHLGDSPIRKKLLTKIDEADYKVTQKERQRRMMVVLSIALLFVVGLVSLIYNVRLREERDVAGEARDDAHRIVSFMLDDLLQHMNNLEPLRQVSEKVITFYERLPEDKMSVEMKIQEVRAKGNLGLVYREMGELELARAQFEEALRDATRLATGHPTSRGILEIASRLQIDLGRVEFSLGDREALPRAVAQSAANVLRFISRTESGPIGETSIREISEIRSRLSEMSPDAPTDELEQAIQEALVIIFQWQRENPDWLMQLTGLYSLKGDIMFDETEYEGSLKAYQRALVMSLSIPAIDESAEEVRRTQIMSELNVARVLVRLDRVEEAETHFANARELADRLIEQGAPGAWLVVNYPFRWLGYGEYLMKQDQSEEAIRVFENSLQSMRVTSEADPKNVQNRLRIAEAILALAQANATVGNLASAHRRYGEALEYSEALESRGISQSSLRETKRQIVNGYVTVAESLKNEGNEELVEASCADLAPLAFQLSGGQDSNIARRILDICGRE